MGIKKSTNRNRDLLLPWLKIMLRCIVVCIFGAFVMQICTNNVADLVVNAVMIYVVLLIMTFGAVRAEERILRQWEENK